MKKFIFNIIIFVSITIIISSIFFISNYLLFRSDYTIKSETNKHILLLGDSNMECAIDDSIFKSSINFASSSDPYYYSYLKLKYAINENRSIDTVFLSFSPHNIFDNGWLLNDEHINSRFRKYYFLMDWQDLIYLYKRNSSAVISSLSGIFKQTLISFINIISNKSIIKTYGSYKKLDRNILVEVQNKLKNGEPLPFFKIPDTLVISESEDLYLKKIIQICQKEKIDIILINLPKRKELLTYRKYGVSEFYEYYDKNLNFVTFLDLSRIEMPDDFYGDFVHLNSKGSKYLSYYLNSIMNKTQQ